MALSFTRHYNSQSQMSRDMGFGWSHTYSRFLSFLANPTGEPDFDYSKIIAWRADGKALYFSGSTLYADPGVKERLDQNPDGSYTLTRPNLTKEHYSDQGQLQAIEDGNGNIQTLTYDALGNLSSVSDPFGRTLHFLHDSAGRIIELTLPTGQTVDYDYDVDGNLVSVTYPDGTDKTYHYEDTDPHNLTGITDQNGIRSATFEYDSNDRAIRSTHPDGADEINVAYTSSSQTKVTNANGNATYYTYTMKSGRALPTRVSGAGCGSCGSANITSYTYDAQLNITKTTDGRYIPTTYTYDTEGNMLTRTEAQGRPESRTTTYTYVPGLNKVATITRASVDNSGQDHVISFQYDAAGNLIEKTETGYADSVPFAFTTTFQYNSRGQVTSIDGPRTDVADITTFTYDSMGNLSGQTRGGLLTTTYSDHTSFGSPQRIIDPNGTETTIAYDIHNRKTSVTTLAGSTQYTYDDAGNLLQVTRPDGTSTYHTYNDANRLVMSEDDLGNAQILEYDDMGNRTAEALLDPLSTVTRETDFQYDYNNRLQYRRYPDGKYDYVAHDGNGNRTSFRDANFKTTSYQYDYLNRLIKTTQPGNVYTNYTYDAADNLTAVLDAENHTTTYSYDDARRLLMTVSPDSGTTSSTYDPAGNLISKTDANGITVTYTYDLLNRLALIDYPTSPDVAFTYDQGTYGRGRLTGISDASGTTNMAYDALGRLITETRTINSIDYVTAYSYDAAGNLSSMTYPSGRIVSFSKDAAGQISRVTSNNGGIVQMLADSVTNLPFGPQSGYTLGNGVAVSHSFDQRYRLTAIAAGSVQSLTYTRDSVGNILAITDGQDATQNQTFAYDTLYRLTSATGPYGSMAYTYDKVGNRLTQTHDGQTDTYTYLSGSNQLDQVTGIDSMSFSYDANGNTIAKDTSNLYYDQNNRLIEVYASGNLEASYTYNAYGQRSQKITATQTTVFHYNRSGSLIAESAPDGTVTAEYVYLNGIRLATFTSGATYYHLNDHLGTPDKLTNDAGVVVWDAIQEPFGTTTINADSTAENYFRFPGQYWDEETGLHYNYHRYYEPSIGRYLRTDPSHSIQNKHLDIPFPIVSLLSLPSQLHVYLYVENNPLIWIDPSGLQKELIVIEVIEDILKGKSALECPGSCEPIFRQIKDGVQCDRHDCMECTQAVCGLSNNSKRCTEQAWALCDSLCMRSGD